ncbi:methylcytosine dioxygenase TET2-like [Scleropages formosus]|uniref:Methylcytosine dioxygenase TET n=1 Tax=Scleropages formosus TaxID=113540 RepID=A0A8C9RT90_SCLFO|nr:methylcytosine dioxygenase TET2-like [Scleropages formosus]
METEKASHEAQDRLTSVSPKTFHRSEHQVAKLQNGNQLSGGFPKQVNGDATWNHFKCYTGEGQMKRCRETCSVSPGMQEMLDQSPYLTNGEANHAFPEPSLLEICRSKKLKVDANINGKEDDVMDKTEPVCVESELGCFSHFSKKAEFDCDVLVEQKQVKESCISTDNGIFSFLRNKPMTVPNGATLTSPCMKGPHGDLITKPLCQYYSDHVTHLPHDPTPQENATKHLSEESVPQQAMHSPSLTSGLPILPKISTSGQLEEVSLDLGNNGRYNITLAMDPQQSQKRDGPLQEVPEATATESLSEVKAGLVCGTDMSVSQSQNSTGRLLNQLHPSNIYLNSGHEIKESLPRCPSNIEETKSSSPSTDQSMLKVMEGKVLDAEQNPLGFNRGILLQKCQQQMEYGTPQQTESQRQHESHSLQGFASSDRLSYQSTPGELIEDVQNSSCDPGPQACYVENRAQQDRTDSDTSFKGEEASGIPKVLKAYHRKDLIDLNSFPLPKSWKTFGSQPQPGQQDESLGSVGNSGPMQSLRTQDFKQTIFCQQDKHMPNIYKPTHDEISPCMERDSKTQPNQINPLSSQCRQQHDSENQDHSQVKQEHLWGSTHKDREQILTSGFSDHHHSLEDQTGSTIQEVLSRDALGIRTSQSLSQRSIDGKLLDSMNLEVYYGQEKHPKISDYKSQDQKMQHQAGLTPSVASNVGFFNSPLQNTQTQHGMTMGYDTANGTEFHNSLKFDQTSEFNHQQKYYPSPKAKKQCLQSEPSQLLSNHKDIRQLPPTPTLMGEHPQLPQGASKLQDPGCMIPQTGIKTEQKEPCSQLQGQLGEYQKHAALRMHLLQKQQHPQNLDDFKHLLQAIKTENGPKLEALVPQHGQEVAHPRLGTLVKQEQSQVACDQLGQKSIIATMEHQLSQYQLPSSLLQDKSLAMKSVNKVKLETSGPVTILSMHANLECRQLGGVEQKKLPSDLINTKKLAPNLSSFLESPIKLLDTPIKNLLETPMKTQYEIPSCHCVEQISERDEGPYYTHLGAAPNVAGIRELMEKRFGQAGSSIRIEKVVYTGKEGKSTQGCPIAKWVIRRASVEEKLLVLVRERAGHTCSTAAMVVAILIWEGIPTSLADQLYTELSDTLTRHGALTNRRCALNEERTCACQGLDPERCGASFSFGCSWSMYYNGCKFARSKFPRKFKLLGDDPKEEEKIEQHLQNLATLLAPKYKQMAPDAYSNQIEHENRALSCRLGLKEGRPFSGVTACLDFCAHAHRDLHNMQGGSTVVCTLTREDNREIGKIPEDEQLHVLPLYKISQTDEFGKVEGQESKVKSGAIQVLSVFRRQVRMLSEPAKSCRQRKLEGKRGGANKSSNQDTPNSKGEKALQAKLKQENIALSTSLPGPQPAQGQMGAVGVGHQPQTLNVQLQQQQQQHQQQQQISNPTSSHSVQLSYPRIPNHSDPFLGSSQPNVFCKSPAGVGSYPSPLHVTNPHMNGSHPPSSYAGSFNTSNVYLGYRCNGSIPVDTYNPFYPPDPKHLSILQQQRPPFYSQQLAAPLQYGVNYPPRYGNHGAQMNNFRPCDMTVNTHPVGKSDTQFLESMPQPPLSHLGVEYGPLSKSSQFSGSSSSYLADGCKMLPPGQDSFRMQSIPEMSLHTVNRIVPMLPSLGSQCINFTPPRFGCANGVIQESPEKQETGGPSPTVEEELWSDNEHNFLDPEIGGVAVAPSHGSILIECAKRELHATTPLKKPDRNHPTRISLVFYQHKNLNEAKHGLAAWEAKMAEKAREKEEDAEKHGSDGTPSKSKKVKREASETPLHIEPLHKHFVQTPTQATMSCTTNTYVSTAPYAFTKTTGPYNRFI